MPTFHLNPTKKTSSLSSSSKSRHCGLAIMLGTLITFCSRQSLVRAFLSQPCQRYRNHHHQHHHNCLTLLSRAFHGSQQSLLMAKRPLDSDDVFHDNHDDDSKINNKINNSNKKDKSKQSSSSKKEAPKRKKSSQRKFIINQSIRADQAADQLAAAFDEMARKEGFDSSLSIFAKDAGFDDNDLDASIPVVGKQLKLNDDDDDEEEEDEFATFDDDDEFDDLDELDDEDEDEEEDDDYLDFGLDEQGYQVLSMEERIAMAKRDMDMGRVSVPDELEAFAKQATFEDLSQLGFQKEINPFGNDETPRKEQFQLVTNAMICSACGSDFQCHNEQRPGYLPPEKFETQVKLSKIEELQKLAAKGEKEEWSTEDEVEWLIQTSGSVSTQEDALTPTEIFDMAEEMDLDLVAMSKKKTICKRCHGLQNFGKVDATLRPGWTKEPLLAQEQFKQLLAPLRSKPAVIIALVDLFDFAGSVLPELDEIAGDNPVLLAANKADLLPSKMGQQRVENWVRRELEYMGVKSIANIGGAVRLVSCKTGWGVQEMIEKARKLADEMDCDIYVVGAANAGKSTLLNQILSKSSETPKYTGKKRAGNENARRGAITTSPLPGTTLKFIQVKLEGGKNLYDTPGLLVPGTITQLLTPEELKMVVPTKRVEPITFRIESGKCVLVGGLARIELIGDSRPFLFTFFVANGIKLHPTQSSKADEFVQKHAGGLLTPPLDPGPERLAEIGEFRDHVVDIQGVGWKEAAADISLTGLGWVAVTGAGQAKVKVSVPKEIGVIVRPPLMPFDVWEVAAKYTGGRAVRKSSKTTTGKRRKGVGRR